MTLNIALMHHQINSTEYLKAFHAPSFEKVVVELLLIIRIFRLTLRFAVFKVNRYDNSGPCKTYIPTCKSYFPTQKRDPEGLLCAISGSPGQNVTVRHPGFLFPYSGLSSSHIPGFLAPDIRTFFSPASAISDQRRARRGRLRPARSFARLS